MNNKCPKCHTYNPDTKKFCGDCGTPLTPLPSLPQPADAIHTKTLETPSEELKRGTFFADRYEIIEELGKGGMGKVYRADDTEVKEEVALKLIKPEIAADKKTIDRFRNELKLARKIRHKNVSGMYDLGEEKGAYFITMEYVPGQDLKGLIRQSGQLAVGTTLRIAKQICEGLAEAHKSGIVHRDLKSSNIMIDRSGNARILDFGIARSLKTKSATGPGVMIGTPEYMSPEQAEAREVDQRSDIYSLGVILYEMLTGKVPFEGDTPLSIAVKHKSEIPKDPDEINTNIPDDLNRVILKCLEKNIEKRFQSSEELRTALIDIEKGLPSSETAPSIKKAKTTKAGRVKKKNLLIYASIIVVLLSAFVIITLPTLLTRSSDQIESIAVLPLDNLSNDPDQEYFADGMTERLISELATISGFKKVISRMSVMQYKGVRKSMPVIARELNVDAVVEGSVLLVGNRVRITVQLIHAPKDRHLWANNYELDLKDILAIQREVAKAIAKEIRMQLTPEEEKRMAVIHEIKPDTYHAYLKGLFYWNKRTGDDLEKAITYFEEAIESDPDYALAYVGLANCYNLLNFYSNVPPKESFPKAKQAAMKAIAIDETMGEAHNSLAYTLYRYYWDFEASENEFKQAIQLNPNYATAHFWYSEFLLAHGRIEEAFKEMNFALELDPVSLIINSSLGLLYAYTSQPEKAVEQSLKTLEMDPDFLHAHHILSRAYANLNKFPEAMAAGEKAAKLSGRSSFYLSFLGYIYGLAGKPDQALKILEELEQLSKKHFVSSFSKVYIYLGLKEYDKVFEFIEKAYEERYETLVWVKQIPGFEPIRKDPRYSELLKKIGFE